MSAIDRHNRLSDLFTQAAALRPSDRETFLRSHDLSDSLRSDLIGLLRHHETVHGPDFTGEALRAWLDAPPEELAAGTHVGPYVVQGLLGRGGGGAVYAARQTGTLERDVALKILDLPEPVAQAGRFAAERNAMALLNHPNIAQIFDADVDALGRAYIAMERVAGVPITQWHAAEKPTVEQTLRVILQAAEALGHAHGRGVIHRDVKPSNLLVVGSGAVASVKVIDFGLVSAAAGSTLRRWLGAGHASVAGTPLFMAPEQAAPDAAPEVRADVYGLGAVLHTLLCGTPPLDLSGLDDAPAASVFEAVRSRTRTKLTASKTISRDLAAVCDKALAREGRYENMAALIADSRRLLNHEPVTARPATFGYIARKFVRRHRAAVALGSITLALLLAGLAGTTAGFVRARQQSELARQESARAQQENTRYRDQLAGNTAVNRFLTDDLLGVAAPGQAGRDVRVVSLLDRADQTLARRFADRPLIEAELRLTLGATYLRLGQPNEAAATLARAVELLDAHTPANSPQRARGLASLGLAELLRSNWDAAQRHCDAALRVPADDVAGRYAHALAHDTLGLLEGERGNWDVALAHGDDAVRLLESLFDGDDGPRLRLVEALMNRATVLDASGRAEAAAAALAALPERINTLLGPDHVYTAALSANLASSLMDQNRHAEALPLLERATPILEREFGPAHPNTLVVQSSLVSALAFTGDTVHALPLAEKLIPQIDQVHGKRSTESVNARHRLAAVLLQSGTRRREALVPAEEAVAVAMDMLGPMHWLTGQCIATRGYAHEAREEFDAARADLVRARVMLVAALGESHARVQGVDQHLAKLNATTRPTTREQ